MQLNPYFCNLSKIYETDDLVICNYSFYYSFKYLNKRIGSWSSNKTEKTQEIDEENHLYNWSVFCFILILFLSYGVTALVTANQGTKAKLLTLETLQKTDHELLTKLNNWKTEKYDVLHQLDEIPKQVETHDHVIGKPEQPAPLPKKSRFREIVLQISLYLLTSTAFSFLRNKFSSAPVTPPAQPGPVASTAVQAPSSAPEIQTLREEVRSLKQRMTRSRQQIGHLEQYGRDNRRLALAVIKAFCQLRGVNSPQFVRVVQHYVDQEQNPDQDVQQALEFIRQLLLEAQGGG